MSRNAAEASARKRNVNIPASKPIYGNFQRYYHIRNPASQQHNSNTSTIQDQSTHPTLALDSRISALLRYISSHADHINRSAAQYCGQEDGRGARPVISVLDVGCNSGKLTIQLAQTLPSLLGLSCGISELRITGVDIDPGLIHQAKDAAAVAFSLSRPHDVEARPEADACVSLNDESKTVSLPPDSAFFPSVFPTLFGTLLTHTTDDADCQSPGAKRQKIGKSDHRVTTPNARATSQNHATVSCLDPTRLDFIAAEWVQPESTPQPFHYPASSLLHLSQLDDRGYHLILALSITKWIHIQQSDRGLIRFFARIASTLLPGGLLVLERQEWRSYHSAKNMDATIKSKIRQLQLRPNGDFDYLLDVMGLRLVDTIGHGTGFGFSRPLQVFKKQPTQTKRKGAEMEGATERGRPVVENVLNGTVHFAWVSRSPCSSSSCSSSSPMPI